MSARKTKEQFISELSDSNIEVLGDYVSTHAKILVRYKDCQHEELKRPSKLLAGQRCGKCAGKHISQTKTKSVQQFKDSLAEKGLLHLELIGEYHGVKKKISVKNNLCGHVYEVSANNVLQGSGCPVCHGFKDTGKFIEIVNRKYPGEYEVLGEYVNNRIPILVKHKCGFAWEVIPKDLLREIRCPKCISSKGELYIADYLAKHGVEFVPQYKFADCRDINPLPFDFMIRINGKMKLIEFDGSQHFNNTLFHNNSVLRHDEIKNRYCKDNGIELLRIPYWWLRNDKIDRELNSFIGE